MKLALAFSISALSLASAYAASTATPPSDEPTVVGFWQESDDEGHVGAWFYFTKIKGHYEGRFVKMFKQKPDDPTFVVCSNCTGDQKDAPMIGAHSDQGHAPRRIEIRGRDHSRSPGRDALQCPDGAQPRRAEAVGARIPRHSLLGQTQVWDRLPDDTMSPCDIPPEFIWPFGSASPQGLRQPYSASYGL